MDGFSSSLCQRAEAMAGRELEASPCRGCGSRRRCGTAELAGQCITP
jgi:hypothetical protein